MEPCPRQAVFVLIDRFSRDGNSVAAETGCDRAAKRSGESTGLEPKAIHRLLETDPSTGDLRRTEDRATTDVGREWPSNRAANVVRISRA